MEPQQFPWASRHLAQVIHNVRTYLRDFPRLNRLVQGEESNARMISWAVADWISLYNMTPPLLRRATLQELVEDQDLGHLIVRGTAITLLESIGHLQTRNQITYSDGMGGVGISDKTHLILGWLQYLKPQMEHLMGRYKVAKNISDGLSYSGGVFSEYLYTSGYYGGFFDY